MMAVEHRTITEEVVAMSGRPQLTQEETLLWMNDRLGRIVSIGVAVGTEGGLVPFVIAKGVLSHRGSDGEDDRSGAYGIGAHGYLDLTGLGGADVLVDENGETTIWARVTDDVVVNVTVDLDEGDDEEEE